MLRLESEGGLYHVINRGNYRADIFHSEVGAKQSGPGGCGIKAAPVGDGAWSTAEKKGQKRVRPWGLGLTKWEREAIYRDGPDAAIRV